MGFPRKNYPLLIMIRLTLYLWGQVSLGAHPTVGRYINAVSVREIPKILKFFILFEGGRNTNKYVLLYLYRERERHI